MLKRIFDIETDGLLPTVSKVHVIAVHDLETGKDYTFSDTPVATEAGDIQAGLKFLSEADQLIGHNIIGYDIPVLNKLYGWTYEGEIYDTLIACKLGYPSIAERDFAAVRRKTFPKKFIGSHSLKAWGYRLGYLKGSYSEDTDWQTYDKDMHDYCVQDNVVDKAIWINCLRAGVPDEALWLEQEVQRIITEQERFGWLFDYKAAEQLYCELADKRDELLEKLQAVFPPFIQETPFLPKRDNKTLGYKKGVLFIKKKEISFNPASGAHIVRALHERYGWEPTEFTEKSLEKVEKGLQEKPTPKVDDDVISTLPYPEAPMLAEYLMIQKRIGMLAEGKVAWLKKYNPEDSRMHGSVNTLGARTRRMTHSNPNCAQVPASHSPYGPQCRALFTVPSGYKLLGIDAAGLELRCMAHFMALYDGGEYVKTVLEGDKKAGTDSHTMNAKALTLSRDDAKTWFYAFIYGAGDEKLGRIGSPPEMTREAAIKLGKKRRAAFLASLPALMKLTEKAKRLTKERKFLYALDKSRLPSPSQHSALNTLLQSAGAIIMKMALVIADRKLREAGLDYHFVGNIHDEFQLQVREDHVEKATELLLESIPEAGEHFNFRCPLEGEVKVGQSWAETH